MKVTWVNHASFVLELNNIRLITDPWIDGPAFDNGWSLLSPTKFGYSDFARITHIWFSHEHPDHFSPPNLRKIAPEHRSRITVLFHETKDKRVLNVCKSLGFITQEMPNESWMRLDADVSLMCGRHGQLDSWLAVTYQGKTLLNMNDCFYRSPAGLKQVAARIGRPDTLLTQFSYANWVGNPDDIESQRAGALEKLEEMANQVRTLKPKTVIPCASFVWFSHQENYFMNKSVNRIGDIYEYCQTELGAKTVVLYPGDEWIVGEEHEANTALARYGEDFERVLSGRLSLTQIETRSLEKLQRATETFLKKAFARNSSAVIRQLPAAKAFVRDLGLLLRMSFRGGLEVIEGSPADADVILSSDSLLYCLTFDWGGDTLAVNGRYEVPKNGKQEKFFRLFRVASLNSSGDRVDALLIAKKVFARLAMTA